MPLKLIPPGKRKNSRFYIVRGRFLGHDVEVNTQTNDQTIATRFKNRLEREMLDGSTPGADSTVTFHKALDLYLIAKNLNSDNERRVKRLKKAIPDKAVRAMSQADLDAAAVALHPRDSNETRNRNVYTPAIAILNYCALNRWCEPRSFSRPKQKQAETRAAADGVGEALIAGTSGMEHLLLLWLFKHGTRITGALSVDWPHIDMRVRTYELYISKNRQWRTFPIDEQVYERLVEIAESERQGYLFPWRWRHTVYDWLVPLCESLGVRFTPHMARHWLGKQLNKRGASIRTIMNTLGHSTIQSSIRYISVDMETVREAMSAIGKIGRPVGHLPLRVKK